MEKIIAVTGGTGFIGSHLVEELLKDKFYNGYRIRCLVLKEDLILRDLAKQREEFLEKLGVEIVYGDLLDKKSLVSFLKNVEKVFHIAAIARPMNVPKNLYYEVNVNGTRNLLEACKEERVKKMVYVSSMSVFGYSRDHSPLTEDSPQLPVSDYGDSKKLAEELVLDFCKEDKMKVVSVRPPMVFGPRDLQNLKLFKLVNTGFFPLLKGGKAKYEFCYVKNLVNGIILADKNGKNREVYNLNDGKTYTIKEICEEIANAEGKKIFPVAPPVFLVRFLGFMCEFFSGIIGIHPYFNSGTALWMSNDNEIDISKARREIGYLQIVPIKESIRETVKYYRDEGVL